MSENSYFDQYSPIQAHKHAVIERYLQAWYPKLANKGRVLYMETHAGRGIHHTGDLGSPLVAINTLVKHSQYSTILNKSEIHYYLMEIDSSHAENLELLINNEPHRNGIFYHVAKCDFAETLASELEKLKKSGKFLAPAFVFIDPYGYKIPLDLVKTLLDNPSCEILLNFMSQPVARAVGDQSKGSLLDDLFGGDSWQIAKGISDFEQRMDCLVKEYIRVVGARWTSQIRLSGQTDYHLLHFTNHPEGRSTMKKTLWKITEKLGKAGASQLFVKDDPSQGVLLEIEPDLSSLEKSFQVAFYGKTFLYREAMEWLLDTEYVESHLHEVMKKGRQSGWLITSHTRPFGPSMGTTTMEVIGGVLF